MNKLNILVTGAAGDLGRGALKILRTIPWVEKISGMDINMDFPFNILYDEFIEGIKVSNPRYLTSLEIYLNKNNIDLIIPASEAEIRYFNENKIQDIAGVPLLHPGFNIMDLGFDKLKTALYLKENGFLYPWTLPVLDNLPKETPCIVKSKFGSGSKQVRILNDNERITDLEDELIYQELLLPDDEEYTCCVFKSKSEKIKVIIFKRKLVGGRTGYGQVVKNRQIEELLRDISVGINFKGSINFQLRLTKNGPCIFEINPRLSSTLVFRHLLGFKDLEWSILDLFGKLETFEFLLDEVKGKKIFLAEQEIIY